MRSAGELPQRSGSGGNRGWARLAGEIGLVLLIVVLTLLMTETMEWLAWVTNTAAEDTPTMLMVAGTGAVLVLLRGRFPILTLLAAAVVFSRHLEMGVAVAALAYNAAGVVRPRLRLPVLAAATLLPALTALADRQLYDWRRTVAVLVIAAVVCVVVPAMVAILLEQREQLLVTLRERSTLAASEARLQERSRVAREMHDVLGHRLSLISLYAGGLELEARENTPQVKLIRNTAQTAMQELRTVLGILRGDPGDRRADPAGPTEITDATGTRADMRRLVGESTAAGIAATLTWSGEDLAGVESAVRAALHRVVQESLTNVHRYAPGAAVQIDVGRAADTVRVTVANGPHAAGGGQAGGPGGGLGGQGTGKGLIGLRERVRLLGGTFSADRTASGGFAVRATLPLAERPRPEPPEQPPAERQETLGTRTAMAALKGAGLFSVAVLLLGTLIYVPLPGRTQPIEVGMTEGAVRGVAGSSELISELAVRHVEPPRPAGTTCSYIFTGTLYTDIPIEVHRYCFRDGYLAEKKALRVYARD
ncbi:hypothetical protein Ssi02_58600 [Sinosporangium siamense]|uniref:histidine kinase n=2 Tax=Sinosporangium siamense TaxID=1367973 RepID=A0A919VEZ7_9ACTN|nr:hypothetical protein Ssi02_58600 [Sinosporangium siamense]